MEITDVLHDSGGFDSDLDSLQDDRSPIPGSPRPMSFKTRAFETPASKAEKSEQSSGHVELATPSTTPYQWKTPLTPARAQLVKFAAVTPSTVAGLLRVETRTDQGLPEATREGMVQSLQPGMWLSASAIHDCIAAFNPDPSDHYVYESGFLDLRDNSRNEQKGRKAYEKMHQTTLYIPINTGNHWVLGIVDRGAKNFELFDPLHKGPAVNVEDALTHFCTSIGPPGEAPRSWSSRDRPNLYQTNSHDCGIVVVARAILQIHQQDCPEHIIPEVWRRAMILVLSEPNTGHLDPFTPTKIMSTLADELHLEFDAGAERPSVVLPTGAGTQTLESAATFNHLGHCLSCLERETRLVSSLGRSAYTMDAAEAALRWLEESKDNCPSTLPDAIWKKHVTDLEKKIEEQRRIVSMIPEEGHVTDGVLEILRQDAAIYRRLSQESRQVALKIVDRVEVDARETLRQAQGLRQYMGEYTYSGLAAGEK
jgi:hypothetical protein